MRLAVVLLVATLALAGCVRPPELPFVERLGGVSGWEFDVEPSMAPDFSKGSPTYPVLLVHQHHVPSERQKEEARRNPVVCLRADGAPMPLLPPVSVDSMDAAMAAEACMGPAADPATGRVYADPADLRGMDGLAVFMSACSGSMVRLDDATREFKVATSAHEFVVRFHDNGTFSVDGRWIEPGTSLKIGYYIARGDAQDEEYVRVVFDAPGEWLWSRVKPWGQPLDGDEDVPPRPDAGTGLVVDVPLSPASLREPIEAAIAATPGGATRLLGLRAVHDGERLTELRIRVANESDDSVTWYGAGRTQGQMRLLGAQQAGPHEVGVDVQRFLDAFDMEWTTLRAGEGEMLDARLAANASWSGPAGLPVGVDATLPAPACDETCVMIDRGMGWQRVPAPEKHDTDGATTLHVILDAREVWWHVAEEPALDPLGSAP